MSMQVCYGTENIPYFSSTLHILAYYYYNILFFCSDSTILNIFRCNSKCMIQMFLVFFSPFILSFYLNICVVTILQFIASMNHRSYEFQNLFLLLLLLSTILCHSYTQTYNWNNPKLFFFTFNSSSSLFRFYSLHSASYNICCPLLILFNFHRNNKLIFYIESEKDHHANDVESNWSQSFLLLLKSFGCM